MVLVLTVSTHAHRKQEHKQHHLLICPPVAHHGWRTLACWGRKGCGDRVPACTVSQCSSPLLPWVPNTASSHLVSLPALVPQRGNPHWKAYTHRQTPDTHTHTQIHTLIQIHTHTHTHTHTATQSHIHTHTHTHTHTHSHYGLYFDLSVKVNKLQVKSISPNCKHNEMQYRFCESLFHRK